MPGEQLDQYLPADVTSTIEDLVQGDGPFSYEHADVLAATEDLSSPSLDQVLPEIDGVGLEQALEELKTRLAALEQADALVEETIVPPMMWDDDESFWARITGNSEVAAGTNQWTYSFHEVEKTTAALPRS